MYELWNCSAYFRLESWAGEQGKVVVVEALSGKQGVRLEDEQLQRKSGTSGGTHIEMWCGFCCTLLSIPFVLVFFCRQKEREQLEMLRSHHEEEIEHHRKEIERLQKEIDRHKGKIRKLKHDDWSLFPIFHFPSQWLPAFDWLYCRSEQDHKRPIDKNLKIKCFHFENACHLLTNNCICVQYWIVQYSEKLMVKQKNALKPS